MKLALSRRTLLIGGGVAVVAGVAAVEGPRLFRKRYAPSPYDDLLDKLDDRDACAQIGERALAGKAHFDADKVADTLRDRLHHRRLNRVMVEDAEQKRVAENAGWVMPETLSLLCALAAKAG
jgi:hypothetical protein